MIYLHNRSESKLHSMANLTGIWPTMRYLPTTNICNRLLSGSLVAIPFFQILGNPTVIIQFQDHSIISFNPLVKALQLSGIPLLSFPSNQVSMYFRKSYYEMSSSLPSGLKQIMSTFWISFGYLALVAAQRNVVFWFLTGSIPSRALLLWEIYTSPSYIICELVETTIHMLFDCSSQFFAFYLMRRCMYFPLRSTCRE